MGRYAEFLYTRRDYVFMQRLFRKVADKDEI